MTNTQPLAPTDEEIEAVVQTCRERGLREIDVFRAVLAKWGQPAHSGKPVAWLNPWRADQVTTDYDAYGKHGIPLYTAPQPVEREPLTHAQAKALVLKYGNDPLHLVLQVEWAHGIKGGQHVS